jgi:hypothetical protein
LSGEGNSTARSQTVIGERCVHLAIAELRGQPESSPTEADAGYVHRLDRLSTPKDRSWIPRGDPVGPEAVVPVKRGRPWLYTSILRATACYGFCSQIRVLRLFRNRHGTGSARGLKAAINPMDRGILSVS